jgi:signal transduction histidine kinase
LKASLYSFNYIHFIFASLLVAGLVSCSDTSNFGASFNNDLTDSINGWIQQSENGKLVISDRQKALEKAFENSNILHSDSVKNNYYSKISYEAVNLNSVNLFKIVNAKSLSLSNKLHDTLKIGEAHWNYAFYYSKNEVVDSAYYHYHKAYENFKKIKHELYTAKMLYNMAFAQGRLKDYTGSEISMFEALTIYKKLNRNKDLYQCYNYLGLIYLELEEFDRAIYYHKKALEYLKEIDNKSIFKEGSLSNLGLVYQKLQKYDEAIESFQEALTNSNLKERDIYFYARLIDNIAYTKFLDGDTTNVAVELKKSLRIRDSINNISGIVISKRHLSEFYASKSDTLQAINLATEALNLANKVENNRDKLESLLLLSKIDKLNSSKYLKYYVHLEDSLQVEERKARNKFTRIRFETDEYIEETEKLSQQKVLILIGTFTALLFISLSYFLMVQRTKNKELLFEREQQKSNEEIFSLMLKQQSKLEEGRLKERHRISEDLHDSVLGKIFGTRIGLGFLSVNGDENDTKKHQSFIDELQSIEKEIREISHELKSEVLSSKVDFLKIVESLITEKSKLGNFECTLNAHNNIYWDKISDHIKINFYRIIQEALQNCIKYSKATQVAIQFDLDDELLKLTIKDNGVGFKFNDKRKGIGLKNMQSRANKLNGDFRVDSTINEGTTIFVSCLIQN